MEVRRIARLATLGVTVISLGILALTAWFITKSLGDVAVAQTSDEHKTLKIQGVNTSQLERILKFVTDKGTAARRLGKNLVNPYAKPAPPPPPVTPAPPAAPATPPASAP
ncbi:MAG: hypothetical protein RL272_537 [Candidatus Parcubacteria bacterium]|jgi:cell division protein FtsB